MNIYNSNGVHEKTPHIFIVTFLERYFDTFTAFDTSSSKWGKRYIKPHNGVSVNVYELEDDAAAEKFDPSVFNQTLGVGVRDREFHWPAPNREQLLMEIAADPDIKAGSMWLAPQKESVREVIQDLPECSRMYTHTETGTIVCGKPTNTYGDGCRGTCIIQGGDQEFEEGGCPLRTFWGKQFEKKEVVVS